MTDKRTCYSVPGTRSEGSSLHPAAVRTWFAGSFWQPHSNSPDWMNHSDPRHGRAGRAGCALLWSKDYCSPAGLPAARMSHHMSCGRRKRATCRSGKPDPVQILVWIRMPESPLLVPLASDWHCCAATCWTCLRMYPAVDSCECSKWMRMADWMDRHTSGSMFWRSCSVSSSSTRSSVVPANLSESGSVSVAAVDAAPVCGPDETGRGMSNHLWMRRCSHSWTSDHRPHSHLVCLCPDRQRDWMAQRRQPHPVHRPSHRPPAAVLSFLTAPVSFPAGRRWTT